MAAFVVLTCVQGPPATAQTDPASDLRVALRDLLESHPDIRAERSRLEGSKEAVREAFGGYLPRLTLSGDGGHEYVDSPQTRARSGATSLTASRSTATLTQNLFAGFRTQETLSAAEVRRDISQLTLDSLEQQLLLDGITTYYSVLRQHRLVGLARRNEKTTKEQLDLEDERVRRGSGIALDRLFAKTRLQLAVERRVQLEGQLEEAVARYIQLFDRPPAIEAMREPELDLSALPATLREAESAIADANPSLKASDRQIDVARHLKGAAAADWYPQLDVVGRVNWENDIDGVEGVRRDWSVMLRMTWELFSGFTTEARVARAAHDLAAAMDSHRSTRRRIDEELRIAWQQLKTARERVRLLDNAVTIAEQVFLLRQKRRSAGGRETAISVLDAQNEVFTAQINHTAALYDMRIAAFRVMFATGLLTAKNIGL